jgi:hypothetical protein
MDQFARSLAGGESRRGVLKGVAVVLLAAAAPAQVPDPVHAISRARRRCRNKKSVYVAHGECHCAQASRTDADFSCYGTPTCQCSETVEGRALCFSQVTGGSACSVSSECPPDTSCVRIRNCSESGGSCSATAQCPQNNAYLNGRCQRTWCLRPCQTP